MTEFHEGEYIIYQIGDRFEIGKIKRVTNNGAFVYYHEGDTAAETPFDCMHKLENGFTVKETSLGGAVPEAEALRKELKRCVNELCLQCGRYRERHKGACDECHFLEVQKGK